MSCGPLHPSACVGAPAKPSKAPTATRAAAVKHESVKGHGMNARLSAEARARGGGRGSALDRTLEADAVRCGPRGPSWPPHAPLYDAAKPMHLRPPSPSHRNELKLGFTSLRDPSAARSSP